jgi:membrane fusion protein (multidrug efflux system)
MIVLLMGTAMVNTGCNDVDGASSEADSASTSPNRRLVRVETMVTSAESFNDVIELTGVVEAWKDAVVSAEAGGQVRYIAPLGTQVQAGGQVARFDDRLLKSSYDAAKAQYDLALDTFGRQQALYRDSIISALEFQTARANRDQTLAMLQQADKQLKDAHLLSSFAGRVEEHFVEQGELVAPGTPVIRVVNTTQVKVTAGVPERYADDIRKGTPVEVRFTAYGNERRLGKVGFVGSVINPKSRSFPVEVILDNGGGDLKPEMVAELFVLRAALSDEVVVPQTAILRDERGPSVFVVERTGEDGSTTVSRRSIILGPSFGGRTVVTEGLGLNEEVVIVGQSNITEGDAIEVALQK